jgi:6-phosphofructokinase 1
VVDYLQRAARHLASQTDVQQSYAVGQAAVEFAVLWSKYSNVF